MIQRESILIAADNCGAYKMRTIHLYGGSRRKFAYLGDVVRCVVDGAAPNGLVKDSEQVVVVIVRTRKEYKRKDGSYIRFSQNAGVVIGSKTDKNPRGTRIFGPIARELKDFGFNKIVSMAKEVI